MSFQGGAAAAPGSHTFGFAPVVFQPSAATLKDNSKATDIFISGVKGLHNEVNGLYSPTQERGRDGRIAYRKCNTWRIVYRKCIASDLWIEKLCIEHFEGHGQVTYEEDMGSGDCLAYTRGEGALHWSTAVCANGMFFMFFMVT